MKLISLIAIGFLADSSEVSADTGLKNELTSSFGAKNIRKREKQSRKMGYG